VRLLHRLHGLLRVRVEFVALRLLRVLVELLALLRLLLLVEVSLRLLQLLDARRSLVEARLLRSFLPLRLRHWARLLRLWLRVLLLRLWSRALLRLRRRTRRRCVLLPRRRPVLFLLVSAGWQRGERNERERGDQKP